jgi:orotate phosphoribosyltransferase-like protein
MTVYLKRDDARDSVIGDYRKRGCCIKQIADIFQITEHQVRYILKREKRKEIFKQYLEEKSTYDQDLRIDQIA